MVNFVFKRPPSVWVLEARTDISFSTIDLGIPWALGFTFAAKGRAALGFRSVCQRGGQCHCQRRGDVILPGGLGLWAPGGSGATGWRWLNVNVTIVINTLTILLKGKLGKLEKFTMFNRKMIELEKRGDNCPIVHDCQELSAETRERLMRVKEKTLDCDCHFRREKVE